jgi:hypothetical protein
MSYAAVDTFEAPRIMPMARAAMAGAAGRPMAAPTEEFSPQKITVTARVSAVFALR